VVGTKVVGTKVVRTKVVGTKVVGTKVLGGHIGTIFCQKIYELRCPKTACRDVLQQGF
jgi:hypothetical protein